MRVSRYLLQPFYELLQLFYELLQLFYAKKGILKQLYYNFIV